MHTWAKCGKGRACADMKRQKGFVSAYVEGSTGRKAVFTNKKGLYLQALEDDYRMRLAPCALRLAPCAVAGAVAVQGMQCGALQSSAGQRAGLSCR